MQENEGQEAKEGYVVVQDNMAGLVEVYSPSIRYDEDKDQIISDSVVSSELTQHYHNGEYKEHQALKVEPLGFYLLVEMIKIEEKSAGGIVLQANDVKREQDGCDLGYVRAIGNIAFRGLAGCNPSEYPPGHEFYSLTPAQIWGINVGDKVEYRRYEGKLSGVKGVKNMRYIPDTQIIGKVN